MSIGENRVNFKIPKGFKKLLKAEDLLALISCFNDESAFSSTPEPIDILREYLELPDNRLYRILDIWSRGTYCFQIFQAYPYVWFIGLIRTGKSKATQIIKLVSFNGQFVVNPSTAFIFRCIEAIKPTLAIDEACGLDRSDKDIVAILNSGYKSGIVVPRVQKETGEIELFDVYCPKVINGLEELSETLQDRSITIKMEESTNPDIINRSVVEEHPIWQKIRLKLYKWTLENQDKIRDYYLTLESPEGISGRDWELWRPLLAIAKVLGDEAYQETLSFAKDYVRAKIASVTEALESQLLLWLLSKAPEDRKTDTFLFGELFYEFKEFMGGKNAPRWVTRQRIAFNFKKLGVVKRVYQTKDGTMYEIDWQKVRERAKKRGLKLENKEI